VWVICSVSVLLGRFARLERIVCSKVPFFPDKISVCQAEVLRLSMCDVQALTSNLFFKKKSQGKPMMSVYIVHTFIIFRCIRFEKERQWLCVRMYVCASLFLGDNEPKKKIHHQ